MSLRAIRPTSGRRPVVVGAVLAVSVGGLLLTSMGSAQAATRATAKKAPTPTVVVSGLNNPRQLSLAWDGSLYIAEAGKGGPTCATGPQGETCIGLTSSISRVARPWSASNTKPVRIIDGLPSGGGPDGSFSVGVDGVGVRGKNVFLIETFAPPDVLPGGAPFKLMGKLLKSNGSDHVTAVADISAAEAKFDPDHNGFDSDPYAVLVLKDRILVADAAANAVFQVQGSKVSVWAVFKDDTKSGAQFVPTSLALAPDGTVYVGGLSGEVPGRGKVVQLTQGGAKLKWFNGFTTVTGVAVGQDGTLYVSELFANQSDDRDRARSERRCVRVGVERRAGGGSGGRTGHQRSGVEVPRPLAPRD